MSQFNMEELLQSAHKFMRENKNNTTQDLSCFRRTNIARKAHSSQVRVRNLVDFRAVSWIWDTRKDYISQLPDDILVNILSRLTLKRAVRTGVLSTTWKHLWTFFSGTLNFDGSRITEPLPSQQHRFVNRVTQALQALRSPSLEQFKICFDLNIATYKNNIDSWVEFAMKTHVKRFHLDLISIRTDPGNRYNIPLHSLGSSRCNSLTALHLKYVDVTGEVIEHLLSTCPLLQVLSVVASSCSGNLKICGPSLKLKYLELMGNNWENIEISAINLVSFKCDGEATSLSFKDVPRLTNASFGKPYTSYLIKTNFSILSMVASQLEMLAFDVCSWDKVNLDQWIYENRVNFPNFNNIKQLQLTAECIPLLSLLRAFPSLQMLSIQLKWVEDRCLAAARVTRGPKHECLRVLEIVGFRGRNCDVELAMYLFRCAMLLEKIIIDPRRPYLPSSFEDEESLKTARSCAQELGRIIPIGAKLLIR